MVSPALEEENTPVINAPTPPPQIEDPMNPGMMIDDPIEIRMWGEEIK